MRTITFGRIILDGTCYPGSMPAPVRCDPPATRCVIRSLLRPCHRAAYPWVSFPVRPQYSQSAPAAAPALECSVPHRDSTVIPSTTAMLIRKFPDGSSTSTVPLHSPLQCVLVPVSTSGANSRISTYVVRLLRAGLPASGRPLVISIRTCPDEGVRGTGCRRLSRDAADAAPPHSGANHHPLCRLQRCSLQAPFSRRKRLAARSASAKNKSWRTHALVPPFFFPL